MSKPIKNLITEAYKDKFGELDGAVLIDIRGVASNDNNTLRATLAKKAIRISVVKNSLATAAFDGTALQAISDLLDGPSALVHGGASVVEVARELIGAVKGIDNVDFKGAVMEGQLFGPDQVEQLSKYPTREEAQAQAVQIILSPGQNLVGAVLGPGRRVASLIKAIEEKLEEGQEIKKAG